MSVINDMSIIQVEPESRLKLIDTATAPRLGVMEPDKVKEEPTVIEFGVRAREITVDGRVNVVNIVDVLVLVEV